MNQQAFNWRCVGATLLLAALLWFATFHLQWGVFWYKISVSALALAVLAFLLQPRGTLGLSFTRRNIVIGVLSAMLLYIIFWIGKEVSVATLPFSGEQIRAVYEKGEGSSKLMIILLLLFVTGPCEEIYWRGYLQRQLMQRFGGLGGWLLATAFYAGVHISSGNFMLTAAAAVAGAFWGAIYWRCKDLAPVIVSHSLWSAFIFAVVPL